MRAQRNGIGSIMQGRLVGAIMDIAQYVACTVCGYLAIYLVFHLSVKVGLFPELAGQADQQSLNYWFFGGAAWIWLIAMLAGIGSFFTSGAARLALLLLPLLAPLLYCIGVLARYGTIAP